MLQLKLVDNTNTEYFYEAEVDAIARTIYGETIPMSDDVILHAVANVIQNRYEHNRSTDAEVTYKTICSKAMMFPAQDRRNPAYQYIAKASNDNSVHFQRCTDMAVRLVRGDLKDITRGARLFHQRGQKPFWVMDEFPCFLTRLHAFYTA